MKTSSFILYNIQSYLAKCILYSLLIFGPNTSFEQDLKPIPQLIKDLEIENITFSEYRIFSEASNISHLRNNDIDSKASLMAIHDETVLDLYHESPQNITLPIFYNGETFQLKLTQRNILSEDFIVTDQKGRSYDYQPGLYYYGSAENYPNSLAGVSIFEDGLNGILSIPGHKGNLTIGKLDNSPLYVVYTDDNLGSLLPFHCEVVSDQNEPISEDYHNYTTTKRTTNCARIYYEIVYKHFKNSDNDITKTVNWMTAIHNNVTILFENDDISTVLSEVKVWTEQDPFSAGNNLDNLKAFYKDRKAFNGNLAILVNSPQANSYAYLRSLCTEFGGGPYGIVGINYSYKDYPVYSFSVKVIAHEAGHILGSRHTHDCAWNGDNTAIDGCGPSKGYKSELGNCPQADIPYEEGGTIMSYCHLVSGVGINFTLGFGSQPAEIIRNYINQSQCLGTDCINSCQVTLNGISVSEVGTNSVKIIFDDDYADEWEVRAVPVIYGEIKEFLADSREYEVTTLAPNTYYYIEARNTCSISSFRFSRKQILILTDGASCEGKNFTGVSEDYLNYNAITITKTLYNDTQDTLELKFNKFNLRENYIFMWVYDGENTSSPLFPNGDSLSGELIGTKLPHFKSTNPEHAITVVVTYRPIYTNSYWDAELICHGKPSKTTDNNINNEVSIYPNPASHSVDINSSHSISKVEVRNITGSTIKTQDVTGTQVRLDLTDLPSGIWFLTLHQSDGASNYKLIKI